MFSENQINNREISRVAMQILMRESQNRMLLTRKWWYSLSSFYGVIHFVWPKMFINRMCKSVSPSSRASSINVSIYDFSGTCHIRMPVNGIFLCNHLSTWTTISVEKIWQNGHSFNCYTSCLSLYRFMVYGFDHHHCTLDMAIGAQTPLFNTSTSVLWLTVPIICWFTISFTCPICLLFLAM